MKKYLMSLAALMIALTATMLTSCSNEEFNEIVTPEVETPQPGTHVETLTIAFPEQTQTRVAIDGYNLTGWELGDEVTLVRTSYEEDWGSGAEGEVFYTFNVEDTYTFTCTNATNGTFTGTMPDPWTVEDCQLAFYNAENFTTNGRQEFYFSPTTRASQNMKDVVMLVAKNDGEGNFEMEIFGSILQVTNNTGADITASVKYSWVGLGRYYDCSQIDCYESGFDEFRTGIGANLNHQITLSKDAPTYVYIPVYDLNGGSENFAVGLSAAGDAANECSIVPFKTNPGNAKLFKKTLEAAPAFGTGSATRTGDINVKWVQLWENGPKFAEYNLGASSIKEIGGYYSDPDETDPATQLWGSNWRTPTYDDVNSIIGNCDVEYTTDYNGTGVAGFVVTGKDDFSANSVFFPQTGYYDENGGYSDSKSLVKYWTTTLEGNDGNRNVFCIEFVVVPFDPPILVWITAMWTKYRFPVRAVLAE